MANNYSKFSTKYHLTTYGFNTRAEADYFLVLLEPILNTVVNDLKNTYKQKGKPQINILSSMEVNEKIDVKK